MISGISLVIYQNGGWMDEVLAAADRSLDVEVIGQGHRFPGD